MNEATIELLILDVDGVLTEGSIVTAADGESTKVTAVQDGCAIKLWQRCGGSVAILSGRSCEAINHRSAELGIELLRTGVADKRGGYEAIREKVGCDDAVIAYVGDDLPDLGPMAMCGFPVAVANALPAVKRAAIYVTRRKGGRGAVAELVELLLRKQGKWTPKLLTQA